MFVTKFIRSVSLYEYRKYLCLESCVYDILCKVRYDGTFMYVRKYNLSSDMGYSNIAGYFIAGVSFIAKLKLEVAWDFRMHCGGEAQYNDSVGSVTLLSMVREAECKTSAGEVSVVGCCVCVCVCRGARGAA